MSEPLLSLICAMDSNRLIGKDNGIPWHLPADLAFFKRTTMGKPIIMGRKTFDSIGRALPGRTNIVVTRNTNLSLPGCEIASSVDSAIALVGHSEEVMLIGGASLYQQSIDKANRIYLTLVHHSFSGDTWFPEIDFSQWKQSTREDFEADSDSQYSYSFIKYTREI